MRKAASRICRERLSTLTSHAIRKRLPVRRTSLRGQVQREWSGALVYGSKLHEEAMQ